MVLATTLALLGWSIMPTRSLMTKNDPLGREALRANVAESEWALVQFCSHQRSLQEFRIGLFQEHSKQSLFAPCSG
jgi:hypothetical protein